MLQIAICEDNPQHRTKIHQIVQRALFSKTDIEVSYYENGIQIMEAIEKQKFNIDLLLLDIHMSAMDGIATAEYIRRNRVDVDIIFITVSTEYVYEGYTYKAFAYILKPIDEQRMIYELKRYVEEKEQTEDYLNIPIHGMVQRVALSKIMYFESDVRKIRIHLKREIIEFYAKMDEVEEVVKGKWFFRCHQSYLINKNYVTSVMRNAITIDGIAIPISRKYQKTMKEILE